MKREDVAAIVAEVRRRGDEAVLDFTERFDKAELGPDELRVDARELEASVGVLEPPVLEGLRTAIANVRSVAQAQLRDPVEVDLPQGQSVRIGEVPVGRVGVYVPGGRAPYPSTVVMCAITARVAGVDQIAVCAPPGPGGRAHPAILAACVLCEVSEVYRMGGAQAIAALAYGTQTVPAVDVIVGPGNAWVTEAKRQVFGDVGIDGLAGPSELVVVASSGASAQLIALDLLAQAEHGEDSPLWLISPDQEVIDAVRAEVERLAPERPTVGHPKPEMVAVGSLEEALSRAEEIAPEHLELVGEDAEALADRVTRAGCVFVGPGAGTAFGDYVAGSNHVLPTGGAARYASPLGVHDFRKRTSLIEYSAAAAAAHADAIATLAACEGLDGHGRSARMRGGT